MSLITYIIRDKSDHLKKLDEWSNKIKILNPNTFVSPGLQTLMDQNVPKMVRISGLKELKEDINQSIDLQRICELLEGPRAETQVNLMAKFFDDLRIFPQDLVHDLWFFSSIFKIEPLPSILELNYIPDLNQVQDLSIINKNMISAKALSILELYTIFNSKNPTKKELMNHLGSKIKLQKNDWENIRSWLLSSLSIDMVQ